jgi:DNA-directed RNA polymerase specialized sigma24 family protein
MPFADIARALGVSEQTVRIVYRRALKKLGARLTSQGISLDNRA